MNTIAENWPEHNMRKTKTEFPHRSKINRLMNFTRILVFLGAAIGFPQSVLVQQNMRWNPENIGEKAEVYRIRQQKIAVRSEPNFASRPVFTLLQGMEIPFAQKRIINGKKWVRFELANRSYWIPDESSRPEETRSPEIPRGHKIVVEKSKRRLTLYEGNGRAWIKTKEYRVGITAIQGRQDDPKQFEGDGKTPEGNYYVAGKNPASVFGHDPENPKKALGSLLLSYPNPYDAWHGLQNGLITISEYERIRDAFARKLQTPQNTNLGSYIMIHGGGGDTDWTIGCVSMNNRDMKEIYDKVKVGTPIEIW